MTDPGLAADVTARFTADGTDAFTVDAAVDVADGETLVVLGPSGSGKTLLLESIAGFHDHGGVVAVDGEPLTDAPPEERDFGFVFQDYALFPHMTVFDNVAYGSRYHDEVRDPERLLEELGVGDLAGRYPPTLSGGEKQRVALARALTVRPSVLLLDEPLAALDVPTRQSLRDDLAEVLRDVTTMYVTHNRTTARALADRIAVMNDGRVVQVGTPEAVFERPASATVARFTGANVVSLAEAPSLRAPGLAGDPERVAVRPEAVAVGDGAGDSTDEDGDSVHASATVEGVFREDAAYRVRLRVEGVALDAYVTDPPAAGDTVTVSVPVDRLHPC
ncbi:MAG: ABC transporter ATP-binding protein [Halolamina sp.]